MSEEMLKHYSRALDEIFRLRRALAFEAHITEGITNLYASLPKGARRELLTHVERMRRAARGEVTHAGIDHLLQESLAMAGAPETLTREQWEATA
jgi:hypothetical protein